MAEGGSAVTTEAIPIGETGAKRVKGRFRNLPGAARPPATAAQYWGFLVRRARLAGRRIDVPEGHVLEAEAIAEGIARHRNEDCLTWLGHAAFLLRQAGRNVLLDPYLGPFAAPLPGLGPRRFVPPALSVGDLPPLDVLIVSHNHYDHLCRTTIAALPAKERVEVVVPLGLGRFFRRRGYARVHELDWHQRVQLGPLTVTALPACHWSRRGPFDRNRSLWASFMLEGGGRRVWFAGDTGMAPFFAPLGERYGPFDLALVPIGAYEPRGMMAGYHVNPEEAVAIGRAMRARRLAAMHWGTVILSDEDPFEPPRRFAAAARAAGFAEDEAWAMRIGETRALPPPWPANG